MNDIPQGWITALLGDIVEINPRHPKDLDDSLSVTFVPMAALSEKGYLFQFSEVRRFSDVRKAYTHYKEGDVLLAKITPCMENGKAALAVGLKNGLGCGTTELHVLRPLENIEPKYIYYFIHQESFRQEAAHNFTGTAGQLRVPVSFIHETKIPLPPFNEQVRIVAKVEELLAKVEASQERLNKIPSILKRFRQSVLAAVCSGRLTADWRENNLNNKVSEKIGEGNPPDEVEIPPSWNWLLSSHEFTFVTSGSRGWAKYYSSEGPIFIRVGNLDHDTIYLDLDIIQHVVPPANAEGLRTKIKKGDILISITADVGMVAFVDTDIGDAYINQHVALARPVGHVDTRYLAYFLAASSGGQWQFQNFQRGMTKVGLGLNDIRSIWIARPPIAEQQEIVRRVEDLFRIADRIEERYNKAKAQVDKLTQSILAKAFRGELVPQCPNDEPASVLLERIQAEKEKFKEKTAKNKLTPVLHS